jgi:hypothetical protein
MPVSNKKSTGHPMVPYTLQPAAWSDRHSNVCLTWDRPDESGLQDFGVVIGWQGRSITRQLLAWQLAEDGVELPLTFVARDYRPDKVTEIDKGTDLELTVIAAFPARNAIGVEFILRNLSADKRTVDIAFEGPASDLLTWEGPFPVGEITCIEDEPTGSWSTLFEHRMHGLGQKWTENFVAGMSHGASIEVVCLTDLSARQVTLPPSGSQKIVIPMAFGTNRGQARDRYEACKKSIHGGWTSAKESDRWSGFLDGLPPLPEKVRGKPAYEQLYRHAAAGLHSLFFRGDGGYLGDKRVVYTVKLGMALAYFWDTAISCVGACEIDAQACQEAIECFTENVSPRGSLPGILCDTHRGGEGQAPVMCWGAWSIYQRSKDKEWLGRVYPALSGHIRFWFKHHASRRGLCQYFNAGQIGDNDARFDPIMKGRANEPVYGFESPDLNAFLVMEMNCLAEFANALDRPDEAKAWKAKARALGQLIVDTMYFPEEAMFYDVKEGTHDKFSDVKNPNMFLPLWAGVPLAKSEIDKIIQNHMLNPDEFYGKNHFPSLSYDHPEYVPDGQWRGRVWPHVVYWMIQTLWKHGYHEEAEQVADRLLELLLAHPWIFENYESAEGIPVGLPEYNWSLSTTIALLLGRYKDPLPSLM